MRAGRDTLLANHFKCKQKNTAAQQLGALRPFCKCAKRLEGKREGNITILWFDHGWFWFIPLADGTTSIGAVCWPYYLKSRNKKPLPEFFRDTIALCPELAKRLDGAVLVDDAVHATGNYSYTSTRSSGERYLMLGDAYAFIDPVFSSGVYLAMESGFAGAGVVERVLDRSPAASAARAGFDRRMRFGPREFSWFIFRVTNPTMRELFMYPQNPMRVKEALMSLLAGDIFGKTPIWGRLRVMKAIYYIASIANLGRTVRAWKRSRRSISAMSRSRAAVSVVASKSRTLAASDPLAFRRLRLEGSAVDARRLEPDSANASASAVAGWGMHPALCKPDAAAIGCGRLRWLVQHRQACTKRTWQLTLPDRWSVAARCRRDRRCC